MLINETILCYIAGFLDGEGWFGISKSNPKKMKSPSYQLVVACTNTDKEPLELMKSIFGGSLLTKSNEWVNKNVPNTKKKNYYYYKVYCKQAAYLIKRVLPYLRMNRRIEKCKLLLELQDNIQKYKSIEKDKLPQSVIEYRENIFKQKFNS